MTRLRPSSSPRREPAKESLTQPRALVTGFAPFDNRMRNASWIAARALADVPGIIPLQLPVVWGAPLPLLDRACERHTPHIIISFGEGKPDEFTVETRASNSRKARPDNLDRQPGNPLINPTGPAERLASIDSAQLVSQLGRDGLPIRESSDAGQFLCEETLYSLESLQQSRQHLSLVTFIHLPPAGTAFTINNRSQLVDEQFVGLFARQVLAAVIDLLPAVETAEPASEALSF